jgi:hypothetical protein
MIGSIIEHPQKAKEILKLPEHCFAICIICIGYPIGKPLPRVKWDYDKIVFDNEYKSVELEDVLEYWKKVMFGDRERSGKKTSPETMEKVMREKRLWKALR